jgi:hypothetical protein
MFSDEAAVTYPRNAEQWQKSVFVPSSCVRGAEPDQGEVKVKVITKDGTKFAVLPSSQRDIVKVEGSDLVSQ